MDPGYNVRAAKEHVEARIDMHSTTVVNNFESLREVNTSECQIVKIQQPMSWCIASTNKDGEFEERTFDLYGILCTHDLPPFEARTDMSNLKKKTQYLRQFVRITGMGCNAFKTYIDKIKEINNIMESYTDIDEVQIRTWQPSLYEDAKAIDCNARYLSNRRLIPHEKGLEFERGVDPNSILSELHGQHYIHGQDNKVYYFQEVIGEDGQTRINGLQPRVFDIGDLVKATIVIAAFPYKDNQAVVTILLKSLTLLEASATEKKASIGRQPRIIIRKSKFLKRKSLFDEEGHSKHIQADSEKEVESRNDTLMAVVAED